MHAVRLGADRRSSGDGVAVKGAALRRGDAGQGRRDTGPKPVGLVQGGFEERTAVFEHLVVEVGGEGGDFFFETAEEVGLLEQLPPAEAEDGGGGAGAGDEEGQGFDLDL